MSGINIHTTKVFDVEHDASFNIASVKVDYIVQLGLTSAVTLSPNNFAGITVDETNEDNLVIDCSGFTEDGNLKTNLNNSLEDGYLWTRTSDSYAGSNGGSVTQIVDITANDDIDATGFKLGEAIDTLVGSAIHKHMRGTPANHVNIDYENIEFQDISAVHLPLISDNWQEFLNGAAADNNYGSVVAAHLKEEVVGTYNDWEDEMGNVVIDIVRSMPLDRKVAQQMDLANLLQPGDTITFILRIKGTGSKGEIEFKTFGHTTHVELSDSGSSNNCITAEQANNIPGGEPLSVQPIELALKYLFESDAV